MNYFDDVAEFHDRFQLPISAESAPITHPLVRSPQVLSESEFNYRDSFLHEEHREFIEGYAEEDLGKMADALVDLVWVALGTAHYLGIPFDALWREVKLANMEKRPWQDGDPIKPRNALGLEVVKPEGWTPPRIHRIIRAFAVANGFRKPPKESGEIDPLLDGVLGRSGQP